MFHGCDNKLQSVCLIEMIQMEYAFYEHLNQHK